MAGKLVWDAETERLYETGVSNGVIWPMNSNGSYATGSAWNGLTSVNESPSGAEATPLYADNMKYLNLFSAEEFGATIECYTYPDAFKECNGEAEVSNIAGVTAGQQKRKKFAFSYQTKIGNDTDGDDHGYKIHIIYACQASPSETSHATVNDSPEAVQFSYEVTTTPVDLTAYHMKPTAHIVIDSTKVNSTKLAAFKEYIYGRDADTEHSITAMDSNCPDVAKIIELLGPGQTQQTANPGVSG